MKSNKNNANEVVFKRESGLQFTKVVIEKISNKAYKANFKLSYGEGNMFMDASIGGTSESNCIEKTEAFLSTKLNAEEIVK